MAYNEAALSKYRELIDSGEPFRSRTCRYCASNAAVKHIDPSKKPKSPWDFWADIVCAAGPHAEASEKAPMYVVGPMVDQSELPFRLLCRRYGATLAYSPMLHARSFAQSAQYRQRYFTTTATTSQKLSTEAGASGEAQENDHPLFVQFCGNDPETVLAAARLVEDQCEAVDFNIGCPQGIARRGHYGSFLMEDWELLHNILHTLAVELRVPVTAKMRIFDDEALTLKYAEMLRDTGIYVLCVHGRTRENKGQQQKQADLQMIRRVHSHLNGTVPIIANGNILTFEDVPRNLAVTGCEGYMCAEPLLWDPKLFAPLATGKTSKVSSDPTCANPSPSPLLSSTNRSGRLFAESRPNRLKAIDTAAEYLELVRRFPVDVGFVKAHLFKMLYHSYEIHPTHQQWLADFSACGSSSSGRRTEEECDEDAGDNGLLEHRAGEAEQTPVKSDIFVEALNALSEHVERLRAAELSLDSDDPQPKRQRGKTVNGSEGSTGAGSECRNGGGRIDYTDAFAGDETFGIDFIP
ncbi:unnamed protein product [Trypanosoma congolense IL3000]|uniref:tRNA-dihydrouridine(16/17) synthase [NAD(P)(+)] n=1 Tax=Trypanosoma congolense (strain IL3000) TaxID=1068625 RepID=F9WJH9_TRYCI|nr:unnamed protein product [Trypanosoma congolense IL3000]